MEAKKEYRKMNQNHSNTTIAYLMLTCINFLSKFAKITFRKPQNVNTKHILSFPRIKKIEFDTGEIFNYKDIIRKEIKMKNERDKEEGKKYRNNTDYIKFLNLSYMEGILYHKYEITCMYEMINYILKDKNIFIMRGIKYYTFKEIEIIGKEVLKKIESKTFTSGEKTFNIDELNIVDFQNKFWN